MDRPSTGLPLLAEARLVVVPDPGGWRFQLRPDGTDDPAPGASRWLVEQLALPTESFSGDSFRLQWLGGPPTLPPAGERSITADQTNRSVVVGEQLVVKWLQRVEDAEHPALRALTHLAEVGFDGVPATFGALTWQSPGARDLPCAFVTGYLAGATDGWQWCVEAVETGRRPDFPAELGRLTARLHVALGSPSAQLPLPMGAMGTGQVRRWHADARLRLDELTERAAELEDAPAGPDGDRPRYRPAEVLAAHRQGMESVIDRLLEVTGRTPVQLVHGDLHVGQVLSWSGGLVVIDFDGSPVLDGAAARQPAARDVAQLLLSLDQVGRIVDRRSGFTRTAEVDAWSTSARAAFLAAYRAELAAVERPDVLDARLLPSFLVEQACRDLLYSLRFLPRWAYATIDGLETILADLPE